jgi:hypothetical protein
LNRLREELFEYYAVSVAGIVFQACLIDRSSISPSLKSTTCERLPANYRTRRRAPESLLDLVGIQWFESARRQSQEKLCKTS